MCLMTMALIMLSGLRVEVSQSWTNRKSKIPVSIELSTAAFYRALKYHFLTSISAMEEGLKLALKYHEGKL